MIEKKSIDDLMIEKKSIDDLMKEGWVEVLEFGFGRKCVLYKIEGQRLIYDELKSEILSKYPVKENYTKR
jgi:hypothetical protein